jgi:hypothetical protein
VAPKSYPFAGTTDLLINDSVFLITEMGSENLNRGTEV